MHTQDGAEGIKKHKWFNTINWEKLFRKEIEPPIKPEISNEFDTSNFEYVSAACYLAHLPAQVLVCRHLKLRDAMV